MFLIVKFALQSANVKVWTLSLIDKVTLPVEVGIVVIAMITSSPTLTVLRFNWVDDSYLLTLTVEVNSFERYFLSPVYVTVILYGSAFKFSNVKVDFADWITLVCERFPTLTVKLPSASLGAVTVMINSSPNMMSLVVNEMLGLDFKNSKDLVTLMLL